MPEVPHISWKRLSVEELKDYYENDPREYSLDEKNVIIALVHLVEEGRIRAFQKPNGEIRYQFNSLYELEKETR